MIKQTIPILSAIVLFGILAATQAFDDKHHPPEVENLLTGNEISVEVEDFGDGQELVHVVTSDNLTQNEMECDITLYAKDEEQNTETTICRDFVNNRTIEELIEFCEQERTRQGIEFECLYSEN